MGKILVVDDDAATRLGLARILRGAGHQVELADEGRECLNLYRTSPADVVIMDLFMPGKEGLETLVELRREFPAAAVIAMTGHRGVELMLRAAKGLGAVSTLAKPFESEVLLAAVAVELDQVRARTNPAERQTGGQHAA